MARSLVIVESPAKAKTINKYLGRNYTREGLLRPRDGPAEEDHRHSSARRGKRQAQKETQIESQSRHEGQAQEPRKAIPVTAENIFEPTYEVIPDKMKVINELRKAAADRRSRLPGRRPGSRRRSHLRASRARAEQASQAAEEVDDQRQRLQEKEVAPEDGNGNAKVTAKEVAKLVVKPPKRSPPPPPPPKIFRVMFNEITPKAIHAAFEHPGAD